MTNNCPMCGGPVPTKQYLDAEQLLTLLRDGKPHREVYRGNDGSWWITYGGGQTTATAVQVLRDKRFIQPVYSSCPEDSFHIGKTWDCERTIAARKRFGKGARDYFIGDP